MKKLAIAASSVALAAMPIVGVFADVTELTDTIQVTVEESCTFQTQTATDMSFVDSALAVGTQATLSNSGTHTFNVFCNDDGGWTVSASAPGVLNDDQQSDTTHDFIYQASAIQSAGAEGKWSAAVSGTPSSVLYIATGGGAIAGANSETAAAGSEFTVAYDVWAGTQTAAGTYEGSVTYTLTNPQTQP